VALTYLPDGDKMVVVGSFGGNDRHPAWYHDLMAAGEAAVRDRERVFWVTAELAEGAEREALWELVTAAYPRYNNYQAATSRVIPLVRLAYSRPYTG